MKVPEKRSTDTVPSVEEKIAEWEIERGLDTAQRSSVYIGVPVTTGRRFINWFRSTGCQLQRDNIEYERALRAEVILPNIQHAARFIELLRWRHVGLIIDPTSVEVPGWSQAQYYQFWTTVINRHARRVIFLDGWEFSSGCVLEFETAQLAGIDCVSESLEPCARRPPLLAWSRERNV